MTVFNENAVLLGRLPSIETSSVSWLETIMFGFRDGSKWGMRLNYAVQERPEGLAQALAIAAPFIGDDDVAFILGDNVFYGHGVPVLLESASARETGATIFSYHAHDPERYGVVELDKAHGPY